MSSEDPSPAQLKASLVLPKEAAPVALKDDHVVLKRVARPLRHVKNIPTKQLVFYSKHKEPQFTYDLPIKLPINGKHIVVQVKAVGLNPVDLQIINSYSSNFNKERGIGREFSGTITHVGQKILGGEFKEGDNVCGIYFHPNGLGTLSSSIDIDPRSDIIIKKPENLSFEVSGSWLITFAAAYQLLQKVNKYDKITNDSNVLINGGSSSVGLMLIQLLKNYYKAESITSICAGSAKELVTEAGSKLCINYKVNPDLPKVLQVLVTTGVYKDFDDAGEPIEVREVPAKKFDLVIDCVGGYDLVAKTANYLRSGGQYVTLVGDQKFNHTKDIYSDWNSVSMNARSAFSLSWGLSYWKFYIDLKSSNNEWLKDGVDSLESGEIKNYIERVYDWKDYAEALKRLKSGHCHGKIVLKVESF